MPTGARPSMGRSSSDVVRAIQTWRTGNRAIELLLQRFRVLPVRRVVGSVALFDVLGERLS